MVTANPQMTKEEKEALRKVRVLVQEQVGIALDAGWTCRMKERPDGSSDKYYFMPGEDAPKEGRSKLRSGNDVVKHFKSLPKR